MKGVEVEPRPSVITFPTPVACHFLAPLQLFLVVESSQAEPIIILTDIQIALGLSHGISMGTLYFLIESYG
jgi:hypothetical protein